VIVDAKIQVRIILIILIPSFFQNILQIKNSIIVSKIIVRIKDLKKDLKKLVITFSHMDGDP
jgi:hypothetical protein